MLGNVNDFKSFVDIFNMKEQLKNFTADNTRMRNNDGMSAVTNTDMNRTKEVAMKTLTGVRGLQLYH